MVIVYAIFYVFEILKNSTFFNTHIAILEEKTFWGILAFLQL